MRETIATNARAAAWRFVLQRGSAAVLALCVVVHVATMIYAVRHGLTADAIVARMHATAVWPTFYLVFVAALAGSDYSVVRNLKICAGLIAIAYGFHALLGLNLPLL